jgi:hypothetical protein
VERATVERPGNMISTGLVLRLLKGTQEILPDKKV